MNRILTVTPSAVIFVQPSYQFLKLKFIRYETICDSQCGSDCGFFASQKNHLQKSSVRGDELGVIATATLLCTPVIPSDRGHYAQL
jgi:hypothetical protein